MAVLQLLLTYWPPLNAAFQTAPIGLAEWGEIVVFAWLCSVIVGLEKRWTAFHYPGLRLLNRWFPRLEKPNGSPRKNRQSKKELDHNRIGSDR